METKNKFHNLTFNVTFIANGENSKWVISTGEFSRDVTNIDGIKASILEYLIQQERESLFGKAT